MFGEGEEQQQQTMNNKKRPTSSGSGNDNNMNDAEAKRKRRLEKNRIAARECRKRKKEQIEKLQREINVMEAENLQLRMQLRVGEEGEELDEAKKEQIHIELDALLNDKNASEADIAIAFEKYKRDHLDYGLTRRSALEYHLQQVEKLLKPTQINAVVTAATFAGKGVQYPSPGLAQGGPVATDSSQWKAAAVALREKVLETATKVREGTITLDSIDPFKNIQDPTNPSVDPIDLFHFIFCYLEITPQQAEYFGENEKLLEDVRVYYTSTMTACRNMRHQLIQTSEDVEAEFDGFRTILTPTQSAKFILWVYRNKACLHVLDELWQRAFPVDGASTTSQY